jgi:hypothetical protein
MEEGGVSDSLKDPPPLPGISSSHPRVNLDLSQTDFVHVLKACYDRQAKLDTIQRTSADEDLVADAGNDLVLIGMIIRHLEQKANEQLGQGRWTLEGLP